jgi:hypothetical protein
MDIERWVITDGVELTLSEEGEKGRHEETDPRELDFLDFIAEEDRMGRTWVNRGGDMIQVLKAVEDSLDRWKDHSDMNHDERALLMMQPANRRVDVTATMHCWFA